ncbi:sensor histidine kinase [Rhodohalobacter sulfatireducens]|uniref:histidine kinase n=1 Tax=Rhodohalobacter sulfatireducens TaxID=2911366 RepID=A0ABS9KCU0_9BACT|nr:HAMP domain-containing sensor histidine kinase [Rhodohalobacter sulfatireducens]MCG2588658.1 HAMP domain-containing histidine kinase [Rhodohalobacter sulfatireducens]
MNSKNKKLGVAFTCNVEGKVKDIVSDTCGFFDEKGEGNLLTTLVDTESIEKALNFLEFIKEHDTAHNWEFFFENNQYDIDTLYFSGAKNGDEIFVIGTSKKDDDEFLDELMKINNEHLNTLRSLMKESSLEKGKKSRSQDNKLFTELSKLNNDLASAQRELAKKTAELEKLNEVKNEMLGMASHDLRNPLSAIMSLSEIMLDEKDQDFQNLSGEQKEFLKQIHRSSQFMLSIIEEMLDISKIESGKINLDPDLIDMERLVSHSLNLNRRLAEKKEISLEFTEPVQEMEITADAQKLEQVLNNLITNAIKYSHSGTHITVRIQREDEDSIILSVEDAGQGIPEKEQKNLFKPFSKTSVKATGGEMSTGLGLAITRRIVEAHGGEIWVESEVGKGSTFFVRLPTDAAE